jgi:hypothetical protein
MSMYPIASQTVGAGGVSSITFSSIPQTFTHLQLRLMLRDSATSVNQARSSSVRFNSDTGNNYVSHFVNGDGSTAAAGYNAAQSNITFTSLENTNTSIFSVAVIDILDYTDTNKNKTTKTLVGWDANGSGIVGMWSSLWLNTNAITSISLGARNGFTGSFPQYSTVQLYGISTSSATGA